MLDPQGIARTHEEFVMGAAVAAVLVVIFLIAVVGYFVVRGRQPAPPKNANEEGPDATWDSDGAVPREPGGMPLTDGPEEQS